MEIEDEMDSIPLFKLDLSEGETIIASVKEEEEEEKQPEKTKWDEIDDLLDNVQTIEDVNQIMQKFASD